MDYRFENLYLQAMDYLPTRVSAGSRSVVDYKKMIGIVAGVNDLEDQIDNEFQEDTPSLLSQLVQVLIGCIHKLLLQIDEVEVRKINPDYVRSRFNEMLINTALPMIRGEIEADGSFDLNEVEAYFAVNESMESDSGADSIDSTA